MQYTFFIKDIMRIKNIKSRTTFYKQMELGEIPQPDVNSTRPTWYRPTLEKHLPGWSTTAST